MFQRPSLHLLGWPLDSCVSWGRADCSRQGGHGRRTPPPPLACATARSGQKFSSSKFADGLFSQQASCFCGDCVARVCW